MANYLTDREQLPAYDEYDPNLLADQDFPSDEEIAEERFVGLEHMSAYDKVEYNALKKNKILGKIVTFMMVGLYSAYLPLTAVLSIPYIIKRFILYFYLWFSS